MLAAHVPVVAKIMARLSQLFISNSLQCEKCAMNNLRINVKGSLLQNGFCTNFSDFEAKKLLTEKCTEKRTEKCTEKCTEKRNVFTEFFHRIFPRIFGVCVCFFLQYKQLMPPRNGLQKIQPEKHRNAEQNPESL